MRWPSLPDMLHKRLTRRDEVRHTSALLQKGLFLDIFKEFLAEVLHLHQSDPHNCSYGGRISAGPLVIAEKCTF